MTLPELVLPSRQNQSWLFSGIDHIDRCLDRQHFKNYPHDVVYDFNSRGFRDQEWPRTLTELQSAIWCIGDSFTVGIGAPQQHNWPTRLWAVSGRRTINVSMDGASNSWISRTAEKIAHSVNPQHMIVMWSYTHRRELDDHSLGSEDRRVWYSELSSSGDWSDFVKCRKKIPPHSIEFTIPGFHHSILDIDHEWTVMRESDWPAQAPRTMDEFNCLPNNIVEKIKKKYPSLDSIKREIILAQQRDSAIPVRTLDRARDGHHFDIVTADWVAAQALLQLNL